MSSDEENWAPFEPHEDGDPRSLAPFVSTPLVRVQEGVDMAAITATDVVCDLGCGDARMLLHLHSLTGARCIGYEINPEQLETARAAVAAAGVGDSVSIQNCDLLDVDLAQFTVIFTFLTPWAVPQLQDKFRAEILERGARVVGYMWEYEPLTKGGQIQVERGASKQIFCYTAAAAADRQRTQVQTEGAACVPPPPPMAALPTASATAPAPEATPAPKVAEAAAELDIVHISMSSKQEHRDRDVEEDSSDRS